MSTGEKNLSIKEVLFHNFQQSQWLTDDLLTANLKGLSSIPLKGHQLCEGIHAVERSPTPQTMKTLISSLAYVFTYLSSLLP